VLFWVIAKGNTINNNSTDLKIGDMVPDVVLGKIMNNHTGASRFGITGVSC